MEMVIVVHIRQTGNQRDAVQPFISQILPRRGGGQQHQGENEAENHCTFRWAGFSGSGIGFCDWGRKKRENQ
ncbi:hypothetical protein SAMN05421823_11810 [Catalinimonas alkaloidigena]|uniref:Uncharacterized protein n=1 Tax=Catalinimonas alkaloidigena TaxID=1075417 RepID=A0A1G9UVS4_9BACT|nr:hypothetical protein SAMN05421823_11810 [Catalinimonas alkaloidigena]